MRLSSRFIITLFVFRLRLLLFWFRDSKFLFHFVPFFSSHFVDIEWSTFTSFGYHKQSHKFVRPRCFIFQWKPISRPVIMPNFNSVIIEYASKYFCQHIIANRFGKNLQSTLWCLKGFFELPFKSWSSLTLLQQPQQQQKVALNMNDRSWMFVAKTNDYLWFLAPCWQTVFVLIS